MSGKTSIEWTEKTWNPTTGCDKVSPGCDHCYALTMAGRLKLTGAPAYQTDGDPRTSGPGFGLALHPERLLDPLKWSKPTVVFVNSMSDLFHARVPFEFVQLVWGVMQETPRHTYQILTKRPDRMARFSQRLPLLPNVWLGTSVEDQARTGRLDDLLECSAEVRFVSAEPLLGPLDLRKWLDPKVAGIWPRIQWVIAGGESGPGARPAEEEWFRSLRDQCREADVKFFMKQLGTVLARERGLKGKGGHDDALLDGERYVEVPA